MDFFHALKIVQYSNNKITVFFRVARLNVYLKVEFSEDRDVLSEKYLAFPVIVACSFVFTTLQYYYFSLSLV